MEPIVQHRRLIIAGLHVVLILAPIVASSFPSVSPSLPQINQRQSREIETEVAHWSAQLKSGDPEERREAAMKLSRIEGSAATSSLVSALTDPSPLVRGAVVASLGERADTSVASPLAARLTSDKDAFVRKTAAYALGRFSGTERTAALLAALKDKDPEVRGAAAVSLGDHAESAAVVPLAAALSDKNAFVRAQAARALGVNGSAARQTVPTLIGLLASDHDGEVKRQAATALGSIGDHSALQALDRATHDSDPYLAQAARDSIRMMERIR
jgi:HEAT repeat protein